MKCGNSMQTWSLSSIKNYCRKKSNSNNGCVSFIGRAALLSAGVLTLDILRGLSGGVRQRLPVLFRRPAEPIELGDPGKVQSYEARGDVPLQVTIYRFGVTAWLWEYVTLAGTVIAFLLGCAFLTGGNSIFAV